MLSFFRRREENQELRKKTLTLEAEIARLNDRIRDGRQENERLESALRLSNESRNERMAVKDSEIELLERELRDEKATGRKRDNRTGHFVKANRVLE